MNKTPLMKLTFSFLASMSIKTAVLQSHGVHEVFGLDGVLSVKGVGWGWR
jgi:hypothetical protein